MGLDEAMVSVAAAGDVRIVFECLAGVWRVQIEALDTSDTRSASAASLSLAFDKASRAPVQPALFRRVR